MNMPAMNPPPYLSGTTAKRIEWAVVIASAAVLPLHAFVTAHQSKAVATFGLFAFLAALLISLFQAQTSRNRWLPALVAFVLYLVHGMFPCA
jgi:hypothetical protein